MKVVAGQMEKETVPVLQASEWVSKSGQPTACVLGCCDSPGLLLGCGDGSKGGPC